MAHPIPTHPITPLPRSHSHQSGWTGPAGQCGVSCFCGLTFDGFDTLAEAAALLDGHIADSLPTPTGDPQPDRCFSTEPHDPHRTTFAPEVGIENFDCPGVRPARTRGHLPIAPAAEFDWPFTPSTAGTPRLGEVIRDAERLAVQLVTVLARQYDPESAPVGVLGEPDVVLSDAPLGRAIMLVHAVQAELDAITALSLPPAGSAVPVHPVTPDRRDPALAGTIATPGDLVGASRARSGGPGAVAAGRGRS